MWYRNQSNEVVWDEDGDIQEAVRQEKIRVFAAKSAETVEQECMTFNAARACLLNELSYAGVRQSKALRALLKNLRSAATNNCPPTGSSLQTNYADSSANCLSNLGTRSEEPLQMNEDSEFAPAFCSQEKLSSSTASEDLEFDNKSDGHDSCPALQPVCAQRFSRPDSLHLSRLALAGLSPAPPTQLHIQVRAWLSGETKNIVQSAQTKSAIFHMRDEINVAFKKPIGTPLRMFLGDTCQKPLPINLRLIDGHLQLIDFLPDYPRSTKVALSVIWLATHNEPLPDYLDVIQMELEMAGYHGIADDIPMMFQAEIRPELQQCLIPVVDDPISDDDLQQPTRISMFDICRRGGELIACGVYMEPSWWWQNPNGAWDFRCELNPSKIRATDPAAYAQMELEMAGIQEKTGPNTQNAADQNSSLGLAVQAESWNSLSMALFTASSAKGSQKS